MKSSLFILSFALIIGIAAFFRLYGLNWDAGQHLNPDERFLTMVATSLSWPTSLSEYFATSESPVNPHNQGHGFYVYGLWPVLLVKAVAELLGRGGYGELVFVGRVLSALADLGTLVFVFLIARKLTSAIGGLLAMLTYSLMVLPMQLSHYYTVDPYVTLGLTSSLYLLLFPPSFLIAVLLGVTLALTLAAKISAAPFIFLIVLYFLRYIKQKKYSIQMLLFIPIFLVIFYCLFRTFMPYLFTDHSLADINPRVVENWKQLQGFNDPKAWFPPGVQWINAPKLLYPLVQMVFFGLGIPFSLLAFVALGTTLKHIKKTPAAIFPLAFIVIFFGYPGIQYAMNPRYFWPIYPVLAVLIGLFFNTLSGRYKPHASFFMLHAAFFICALFYPLSYLSIYATPHTRVAASKWIYANLPRDARLSHEHWDDPLPLNLPEGSNGDYIGIELPMYNPDTPEKWKELYQKLDEVEYLVLTSNRVYGSITSAPDRFPQTAHFYEQLFAGELSFVPIAQFASRPRLPIPGVSLCITPPLARYGKVDEEIRLVGCDGITFVDDYADESWTVYDHPKVTIFKNTNFYDPDTE